jgi:predicted Zn-dependent peptidase
MDLNKGPGPLKCERTALPNGVRVLSERLDHVDSVSLGIWVVAGASDEPPGMEGINHFAEHMLFKGTERRSALEIAEACDELGGNVNGFTERECVYLFARTISEQVEAALDLLFDALLRSVCRGEDVEREKEVVLQEIRHMEDTPEDWVHELLLQAVWPGHPLGRPVLGSPEGVRSVSREALLRHRARMHVGSRIVVSAAGRLDHAKVVDVAARHSADLPHDGVAVPYAPPAFHPSRTIVSRPTGQVHFCVATPACGRADERRHAFAVLDTVLGGGSSSRLFQEIRENRGLAYSIGSYLQAYDGAGLFTVDAGTAPENLNLVLDLISEEVARLRADGPSAAELARAKTQIKVGIALASESTSFRMQHLAVSDLYWGRVLPFAEIIERLDAVTAEDVYRLAQEVFVPEQQALVAVGPF